MSDDEELALLVDRYLDGELDAVARARLANDPPLLRRFVAELRFQGRVAGLLRRDGRALLGQVEDALALGSSTGIADRVLARVAPRPRHRWWRRGLLGGLAAGLVAAITFIALPVAPTAPPAMAAVAGGDTTADQHVALNTGSRLVLGVNQEAQVDFTDGTRVDLGSGGTVRLAGVDRGGARLALEQGHLSAEVAKQPTGSHFEIATADAVLTVLGTRLTATRLPWGTRVEVTEGLVRTRRASDGNEVEIRAGKRVDVGPGPMTLMPIRSAIPVGAVTLTPSADAIVVGGRHSDENRGKRPMHVVTSPSARTDELRVYYLRFDLRAVTSAPARAELRFHLAQLRHAGMRLHLARIADPWDEKLITWNKRPTLGEDVATWLPDAHDTPVDLTAAVAGAIGRELSLCLHADPGEGANALVGFHTREAPPLLRPVLVILPSPKP